MTNTTSLDVRELLLQSQFTPMGRQIRARNKFYASPSLANGNGPEIDSPEQAMVLGAPPAIISWWRIPGFADWWCSPTWEKEESHRLLIAAMHKVSDILRDEDDSTRLLSAAREAREIYVKLQGTDKEDKYMDSEIGNMSQQELQEFIKRNSQVTK